MSELVPKEEAVKAEIVELKKELDASERGIAELERVLRKRFTPEKLEKYLIDLCEAEDVRLTRDGEIMRTPNWEARKNGFDRALQLLRYVRKDNTGAQDAPPAKIIFNIVNQLPKTEPDAK